MSRRTIELRQRIIDRALALFNEHGLERIGMRELARDLQLRPGNLTYHFARKEDLILAQVGGHTADVERRNRTARQMNGRLVRKTLSYSRELEAVEAASTWEDWVYNLTRTVDTRSIPDRDEQGRRRWQRQTPAMEAGLTDHRWTSRNCSPPLLPLLPLNCSTRKGEKTSLSS